MNITQMSLYKPTKKPVRFQPVMMNALTGDNPTQYVATPSTIILRALIPGAPETCDKSEARIQEVLARFKPLHELTPVYRCIMETPRYKNQEVVGANRSKLVCLYAKQTDPEYALFIKEWFIDAAAYADAQFFGADGPGTAVLAILDNKVIGVSTAIYDNTRSLGEKPITVFRTADIDAIYNNIAAQKAQQRAEKKRLVTEDKARKE